MDDKIDWAEINAKLPVGKSPEEKARRLKMFRKFDPNGNGVLSLAEVDRAIRDELGPNKLFDAKPAIMRAFQIAKNFKTPSEARGKIGDDYVELKEFKFFLLSLRQYFEYYVAFMGVDDDKDKRISLYEFRGAQAKIEKWVGKLDDVDETFNEIDTNQGGHILFEEFCEWAITKSLDLEDDEELEGPDFIKALDEHAMNKDK